MYIGRKLDGSVYGAWTCRQPEDADHPRMEELPDDHPDVIAFVNRPRPQVVDELAALEARVVALEAR